MATNVMSQLYDTLLCSPGMGEAVRIDAKISRKSILLLNSVIEKGLSEPGAGLLEMAPKESIAELQAFSEECLGKAGLKELSEKMKGLQSK